MKYLISDISTSPFLTHSFMYCNMGTTQPRLNKLTIRSKSIFFNSNCKLKRFYINTLINIAWVLTILYEKGAVRYKKVRTVVGIKTIIVNKSSYLFWSDCKCDGCGFDFHWCKWIIFVLSLNKRKSGVLFCHSIRKVSKMRWEVGNLSILTLGLPTYSAYAGYSVKLKYKNYLH